MKSLIIFIASAALLIACTQGNAQDNLTVKELNAIEFDKDDNKVVLDVRTPQEYAEGRITGSENLDVLKTDFFTTSIAKMDKEKTYYVICRSGARSQKAVAQMKEAGFKDVYNISGGMQAWESADFETEK
ncbi:rhodanese-like domain-containing protein [Marivirga harenae]|uniref:rhodanese-like domain-containing protein n=1 Tax=Marivirga harenae TaxID=2010992 RepID=UPI0026E00A49|nr:rhodanese-like domain-containing protein [Marivirga harenae]WKV11284.1 rhodanese-like domain-containing protein [Marivirga harenae]|tara:strand:- start:16130 stop:16519 length:390 start_codon:yes stop_codon:yes gene_type:complete